MLETDGRKRRKTGREKCNLNMVVTLEVREKGVWQTFSGGSIHKSWCSNVRETEREGKITREPWTFQEVSFPKNSAQLMHNPRWQPCYSSFYQYNKIFDTANLVRKNIYFGSRFRSRFVGSMVMLHIVVSVCDRGQLLTSRAEWQTQRKGPGGHNLLQGYLPKAPPLKGSTISQ